MASTTTLRHHVPGARAEHHGPLRSEPARDKQRRYTEFYDGAGSWSRVERIIARVEAGPDGVDTRFVVTNLTSDTARRLYDGLDCQRGQAENHVKAWKRHLAADRTSCSRASANQLRLMLHTGAYWLLWSLRSLMPKRSSWRVAQFDTLRLRLVKLAVRVVALKTRVMLHLPSAYPAPVYHAPCSRAHASPDLLTAGANAPAEPSHRNPNPAIRSHSPTRNGADHARPHNHKASHLQAADSSDCPDLTNFAGLARNTVHFVILIAAAKSIRAVGSGVRGLSG